MVINWTELSREINRKRHNCCDKWMMILRAKMKQGTFTQDECDIIRQRVKEWGGKGRGLWVSIQGELGRPSTTIKLKWSRDLRHRERNNQVSWV